MVDVTSAQEALDPARELDGIKEWAVGSRRIPLVQMQSQVVSSQNKNLPEKGAISDFLWWDWLIVAAEELQNRTVWWQVHPAEYFWWGWERIRDAAQDLEHSMYSFGHAFLKGWAWAEVVAKTESVWGGYQVRGNQSNLAFSAQSRRWVGEMTIVNAEEEGEVLKKCWYKNRQAEMGG